MNNGKGSKILKIVIPVAVVLILLIASFVTLFVVSKSKYDMNIFNPVPKALKSEYVLDSYDSNKLDYLDLVDKVNSKKTEGTSLTFSELELAGFIDKNYNAIKRELDECLNGDTAFVNFRILSMDNGLLEIESSLKVSTSKYLESLDFLPKTLVKSKVSKELSLVVNTKMDTDNAYEFISSSMSVNGENDTDKISKILNFDFSAAKAKEINEIVFDSIMGKERSLYKTLTSKPGLGSFKLIDDEIKFEVYYIDSSKVYTINFINDKGVDNPNKMTFMAMDEKFDLIDLEKDGYEFLGFYNENDKRITAINPMLGGTYNLTCKWDLITYTISYNYNGGLENASNPTTYTVESDTFTIPQTSKGSVKFNGWIVNASDRFNEVVIETGSFGDINLFASFEGNKKRVNVIVGENINGTVEFTENEPIIKKELTEALNFSECGLAGYDIIEFYEDAKKKTKYDLSTPLKNDITLYGDKKYIVDKISFYEYLSEFDNAINKKALDISSFEMLTAYIDYVRFYNVTEQVKLNFKYDLERTITEEIIQADLAVVKEEYFETGSLMSYGENAGSGVYFVGESYREKEAKKIMDKDNTMVFKKIEYGIIDEVQNKRPSNFDDFKVNNIDSCIQVSSSEQLVWALLNGYKPNAAVGTKAYIILEESKDILRNIIGEDYTDLEKIEAIYLWLIKNNSYDNFAFEALNNMTAMEAKEYDSWYAEGIFLSHRAVCEGFAKAMVILSRIEGIPCITQTGNGHEWNKVMIDGKWYVIDATHGNLSITNMEREVVDFSNFLISENTKSKYGYSSEDFSHIKAIEDYDYFANKKLIVNDKEFDLYIDAFDDLENLLKYLKANKISDTNEISVVVETDASTLTILKGITSDFGLTLSDSTPRKYYSSTPVFILVFNYA